MTIITVVHNFQAFGCHARSREGCTEMLRKGYLIGVAPGGGYEAQLGTPNYQVMWKKRSGFAAIAFDAKVPVIPMFTENIREAFVNMQTGMKIWSLIYKYFQL
jgi:1-acyl-sn-glycerol-3-phosphate acyltransferase